MKNLILLTFFISQASFAQIYQWHLKNNGQEITETLTTSKTRTFEAQSGVDLGISADRIKNVGVVSIAILDTGADLSHPQIKDAIFNNPKECSGIRGQDDDQNGIIDDCQGYDAIKNLGITYSALECAGRPGVDEDGNGLVDDCYGYDFAKSSSINFFDNAGHGTHLAGIASSKNDLIGAEGISDRIKILPIKVVTSQLSAEFAASIVKGIKYAVSRKVDVINLSLGITNNFLTPAFIDAINLAISQGIQVVASAGNNKNINTQPPCNLTGVICVGGSLPDGGVYLEGNSGGHVDVLAPAVSILSTYPLKQRSLFYQEQGYEVLSGTSQSAIMVSSLVGIIKKMTSASSDVVKARLYLGTQNVDSNYSLFGQVNLENSLSAAPQAVVVPDFKNINTATVENSKIQIPLTIRNLWAKSGPVTIKISSDDQNVEILNKVFSVSSLNPSQASLLPLELSVSAHAPDQFNLVVEISTQGVSRVFKKNVLLLKDYHSLTKRKLNLNELSGQIKLNRIANGALMNDFKTLTKNNVSELYVVDSDKKKLLIIKNLNSEASILNFNLPVEVKDYKLEKLQSPAGEMHYVLMASFVGSGSSDQIGVIYLNASAPKLVKFREHAGDVNFGNLSLIWDKGAAQFVPVAVLNRLKPAILPGIEANLRDLNLSAFKNKELVKFTPDFEASEFKAVSMMTEALYKELYRNLRLSWDGKIEMRFISKMGEDDANFLLFTKSTNHFITTTYEVTLNLDNKVKSVKPVHSNNLSDSTQYAAGTYLSDGKLERKGLFYHFFGPKASARSVQIFSSADNNVLELGDENQNSFLQDAFFHHFSINNKSLDIFMSDSTLHFISEEHSETMNVDQFVYHEDLLAQTYEALLLRQNNQAMPAVISNQDHTFAGMFKLIFWKENKPQTSANWSFMRPSNCSYIGVVSSPEASSLSFLCQNAQTNNLYLDLIPVVE